MGFDQLIERIVTALVAADSESEIASESQAVMREVMARLATSREWMMAINADAARNVRAKLPADAPPEQRQLATAIFAAGFARGVAAAVAASSRG